YSIAFANIFICVFCVFISTSVFAALSTLNYRSNLDVIRGINIYDSPTTDKFAQFLAIGYRSYALYKNDMVGDYNSGNYFAKKAFDAYSGVRVKPEILAGVNMPAFAIIDMDKARDDLSFLLRKDVIEIYPFLVADAQTKYDCWFDQTLKGMGREYWEPCKERFQKTLRLIYQKMDEDCFNCMYKNKSEKTEVVVKVNKRSDELQTRMPRIPRWNPDNELKVQIAPKYDVNLPDVMVNTNAQFAANIAALKDLLTTLDSKVSQLGGEVQNKVSTVKVDISVLDKSVADINNSLNDLKSSISDIKETCANCNQSQPSDDQEIIDLQNRLNNLMASVDKLATVQPVYKEGDTKIIEKLVKIDDDELKKVQGDMEEIKDLLSQKQEQREEQIDPITKKKKIISTTTTTTYLKKNPDDAGYEILIEDEEEEEEISEEEPAEEPIAIPEIELPLEIFFDWGSYEIDARFNTVLQQIADMMNDDKTFSIVIEGHTDTSGPAAFNMDLSNRRANNVMQAILSHYEIDANRFIIQPRGQTDLKIQTADGIKEPENRRAKIIKITK
ncbi:MAG: OmpA family protein, partial [Rickettsiales bacterium]|nr:OmpA family protein [Rickettsiales bacterium]